LKDDIAHGAFRQQLMSIHPPLPLISLRHDLSRFRVPLASSPVPPHALGFDSGRACPRSPVVSSESMGTLQCVEEYPPCRRRTLSRSSSCSGTVELLGNARIDVACDTIAATISRSRTTSTVCLQCVLAEALYSPHPAPLRLLHPLWVAHVVLLPLVMDLDVVDEH